MCGFAGIYDPNGLSESDRAMVERMGETLSHRGPDGAGRWEGAQLAVAHRRLAIIDLDGGHQPMLNDEGTIGIAYNGEIYNYRELRDELRQAGCTFRTQSDTEVIIRAYETWGVDFVSRLSGMFAFVLWDTPRGRSLLVRDRYGVKPLYVHRHRHGAVAFASEIKAILIDPRVPREMAREHLAEYLLFRTVAGSETMFRGITEIEPGTVAILAHEGWRTHRYWSIPMRTDGRSDGASAQERASALLADSVRSRLVSDVTVGTITSGGLDSSLVSAIAAHAQGRPIDTFCVGFVDPANDERPWARMVADHIGSRHHEYVLQPSDFAEHLDVLTWANDEPLTHANAIPMHLVFRHAKERAAVTVVLSGEGADELFGGYGRYRAMYRRERLRRIPGVALLARGVPGISRLGTLRRVFHPGFPLSSNGFADPTLLLQLGVTGVREAVDERSRYWPAASDDIDALFGYDQATYLPALLQRQDRMSMAAGVEAREPFLDHVLAEWVNGLGWRDKLVNGEPKALLKAVGRAWLPAPIIERRKVGFAVPIGAMLARGGVLADRVQALCDEDSAARDVLDAGALRGLIEEHWSGRADRSDLLWTLMALDAWSRVFLRGSLKSCVLPGVRSSLRRSSAAFI